MKQISLFTYLITVLFLSACSGKGGTAAVSTGDTIKLKYADNLPLIDYKEYKVAQLRNP